jgi:hypothetical protein
MFMKTIKCAKTTITALILVFCGITTSLLASTVNLGTLTPFTGGDAGEGIDLTGDIVLAFNLGGEAQTVQGVPFVPAYNTAPPAGISSPAATSFSYFNANGKKLSADYGTSANDNALEQIVTAVWYHPSLTIDLVVTPGIEYKLQLILQEGFFTNQGTANRNFDISVESAAGMTNAVMGLVLGTETDGAAPAQPGADQGLVYTYTFTATDSSFRVTLADNASGADVNAILAAVTLEALSSVTVGVELSATTINYDAPVGKQVGVLNMVNANSAGFTYSLQPGGDTTHFDIPAGTGKLLVDAPLSIGTYDIAVLATNAASGVWATSNYTIKAASRFYDFSTDPGIASDWKKYAYYNGDQLTPTWNAVDGDLDLVKTGAASGLYPTSLTRAAGESVSMTVKALNRVSGSWGFVGLMISAVPQPGYITTGDNTYTLRMDPTGSGATTFKFLVTRTYLDGTSNFILYTSPSPIEFSGPYVLDIKRVGDNYEFLVNGSTIYTTTGIAPDAYTPADKDAMIYYEIVIGCDGTMTATVDDFGVTGADALPQPVQYWLFDDRSGSTAANLISGGNTGTLVNSPSWITGGLEPKLTTRTDYPSRAALDFDSGATPDYVNCGNIGLASTAAGGEVTISMWINPDSFTGDDRIISQLGGVQAQWAGAVGEGLPFGTGALWVYNGSQQLQIAPASALTTGSWQHLALTWYHGTVMAWVDGVPQMSATANAIFNAANLGIAAKLNNAFGTGFDGKIDEVAIFKVALNEAQIIALANGSSLADDSRPKGTVILVY